jgi:beta-glucanase (GH16 family)
MLFFIFTKTNTMKRNAFLWLFCLLGQLIQAQTWVKVWADEFESNGLPDSTKWMYDVGGSGWGNNELQYYTRKRVENARVENGQLVIEARKENYQSNAYTSARIKTQGLGEWKYGRVEVRAKIATGRGMWPAIWMLPTDAIYGNWPSSGEIDIMENVGYDPDRIHFTIHTEAYNHTLGTQKNTSIVPNKPYEAFHDYVVEWYPDSIVWYFDQTKCFKVVKEAGADYKKWPFDNKFHLLLNVAVGGDWGGANGVDQTVFPQKMLVDYVRVYQMPEGDGPYTVKTNTTPRGIVSANPAQANYAKGTEVTLTAQANAGFVFRRWYGTLSGLNSTLSLPMYFHYEQKAEFVRQGELLQNPIFMGKTAFWSYYGAGFSAPNDTLKIAIPTVTVNPWDIQMSQSGLNLQQGKKYKLRLTAKTTAPAGRTINLSVGISQDPWTTFINNTVSLTNAFKTFEYTLTMNTSEPNARVTLDLGKLVGDVWVSEVSLIDESVLTSLSEDESLQNEWTLFPTVTADEVRIECASVQAATFALCQSDGTVLQNVDLPKGKGAISLRDYPNGLYLVVMSRDGSRSVKRVLKR